MFQYNKRFVKIRSKQRKIGFFGGTFDPIHLGHVIAAKDAVEHIGLDAIYFIPAARPPLKDHTPIASDKQRLQMIKKAIRGIKNAGIITDELAYTKTSYTIETVERLKKRWPKDRMFWIIGADQVEQLSKWHRIDELVNIIEFICVNRPGHILEPGHKIPTERLHYVPGHNIDISSTNIRQRILDKISLDFILPFSVQEYIKKNNLYGA